MRTYVFASATVRRWLSAATSRWRERALAMRGASPCADRAPPTLPPPLVQLARPATARRRAGPGTAPLGALLFVGARQAVPWFAAFAGLVAVSAAMDPALSARAPDVPGGVVVAMFAMTVLGVATTTFVLLEYFVRARQRALAALELERAKSERLLLNVLPEPVAARLKEQEGVIADACPDVTGAPRQRAAPTHFMLTFDFLCPAWAECADRMGLGAPWPAHRFPFPRPPLQGRTVPAMQAWR